MKDTLEYKILKYLSENDNGELLDLSFLSKNEVQFKKIILDLKNKDFIVAKKFTTNGYDQYFLCQIKISGKLFLDNIETKEVSIKNHQKKSRLYIILSNPWFVGISLAIFTAILNGKIIMNFINKVLDKIYSFFS